MTRDDAKAKLLEGTANACTERWMEDFIDSAAALGLLKLEEPKGPRDKFADELSRKGYAAGSVGMRDALAAFDSTQN